MAFKMKNASMAKLVKEAGNNRIIKRMNKLQDKAEKANARGNERRAQRKIDKISKLEDKLMGAERPEPTFEGTDEFRSKRKIRKQARKDKKSGRLGTVDYKLSSAVKLKEDKGPGQGTKVGQFTGAGIPKFLYDADGNKINTNNIDEGNLSKIKLESGTNRKYVVMQEDSDLADAGARFYLSNPK